MRIPDRLFVKMVYAKHTWSGPVSVPNGADAQILFSIKNSLNDPQHVPSTDKHQPLWYDQYCPFIYKKYRVYGVKYDITVNNQQLNQDWQCFVQRSDSAPVPLVTADTLTEDKAVHKKLGGGVGSRNQSVRLKGYWDVAKTLGISKSQIKNNDNNFAAGYDSNPFVLAYLNIWIAHNHVDPAIFDYNVKFTYYAELFDRALAVQSA